MWNDVDEKGLWKSRLLGIYFGETEITVSVFDGGNCRRILTLSACVAVTEVGEILTGSRMARCRKCRPDLPVYSVLELMRRGQWKKGAKVSCGRIEIHVLEMCDRLMEEVSRELNKTAYRECRECIVSMPSYSFLFREYLEGILERAGFRMRRLLYPASACAVYCNFAGSFQNGKKYLVCAVTKGMLEMAFLEADSPLAEILYEDMIPLRGAARFSTGDIIALAVQRLKKMLESDQECLQKCLEYTDAYVFLEDDAPVSGAKSGNLNFAVSAGAALMGAFLLGAMPGDVFALVTLTPTAYGIEIRNASDKQIVRQLQWIIPEQYTIPARKSFLFSCAEKIEYELVLNVGHTFESDFSEKITLSPEDTVPFMKKAEETEISVDLDTNCRLSVWLTDPSTGEQLKIPVQLPTTRISVPDRNRTVSGLEILQVIWTVMKEFRSGLDQLNRMELISLTGQGLVRIEKQCDDFLARRSLSWERKPVQEDLSESVSEMLCDFLGILDSLEFGIRKISGPVQRPEMLMIQIYRKFLRLLDLRGNLRPVEAEGSIFDVNVHTAVGHETDPSLESSVVIQELQRGYYLGNKLLRPALVKVAN